MFSSALMPPCMPMITEASAGGQGVDVAVQVGGSHDVEDHVGARAVGLGADPLDEVLVAVVDGDVGAQFAAQRELVGGAGRHRDAGAERVGHLDGVGADAAGAAVQAGRADRPSDPRS